MADSDFVAARTAAAERLGITPGELVVAVWIALTEGSPRRLDALVDEGRRRLAGELAEPADEEPEPEPKALTLADFEPWHVAPSCWNFGGWGVYADTPHDEETRAHIMRGPVDENFFETVVDVQHIPVDALPALLQQVQDNPPPEDALPARTVEEHLPTSVVRAP